MKAVVNQRKSFSKMSGGIGCTTHKSPTNSPNLEYSKQMTTRGSWGIFSDSSVTLAQWWRAQDSNFSVIRRSPVRFRPKTRQLRFTWIWANRPSSKNSKQLFPVISKLNQRKRRNRKTKWVKTIYNVCGLNPRANKSQQSRSPTSDYQGSV